MDRRSSIASFAALLLGAAASAQEQPVISVAWCGYAHNVTGGGESNFTAKIFEGVDGAPMTLDAQWPDEGLYGRFLGANDFAYACNEGRLCMQFTGLLTDLEAGGYPEGTAVAMTVAIDAADDGSSARGAYRIESLGDFPVPQYGVMELGTCEGV